MAKPNLTYQKTTSQIRPSQRPRPWPHKMKITVGGWHIIKRRVSIISLCFWIDAAVMQLNYQRHAGFDQW